MKIIAESEAINKTREDGTRISYYLFNEYEVHCGELPSGVVQPWHHHEIINETLYLAEGKLIFHYLEGNQKKQQEIVSGTIIQVENTPHTFSNPFSKVCKLIAFRFVPKGKNQREVIKNDKVLHPELD